MDEFLNDFHWIDLQSIVIAHKNHSANSSCNSNLNWFTFGAFPETVFIVAPFWIEPNGCRRMDDVNQLLNDELIARLAIMHDTARGDLISYVDCMTVEKHLLDSPFVLLLFQLDWLKYYVIGVYINTFWIHIEILCIQYNTILSLLHAFYLFDDIVYWFE